MTEPDKTESKPVWSLRSWRIPPRLFGRVRTSTVLLGICFVLTSLLYNQLSAANEGEQNGPTAIDPGQFQTGSPQTDPRNYNSTSTTLMPTTPKPSGTGSGAASATPATPGSSTGGAEASPSRVPTYMPGLTVPPDLRSLFPPVPAAPGATGAP